MEMRKGIFHREIQKKDPEQMSTSRQVFSPAQRQLAGLRAGPHHPGGGQSARRRLRGHHGNYVESVAVGEPGLTAPPRFVQGLAAIEIAAAERGPDGFAALSDEVPRTRRCGRWRRRTAAFSTSWCLQVYSGYYTDLTVFDAIGYTLPSVPTPGAKLELLDESLLEAQRQRPPFWTRV